MNWNINKDFLKEEIRDEYLISEKQKKIWLVQLDLCKKLFEVCKRNNIKVFLFGGSLLGAVRHKGYIPWDDDMDVALLRSDFDKLTKIANQEFNDPYFFQTASSDKEFFFGYARLRNSETTGVITYNNSDSYNNGIFIDIFVLDGYTDDENKRKKQVKKIELFDKILGIYYAKNKNTNFSRRIIFNLKQSIIRIIPYEVYINKYNKILQMYNIESTKVSCMTHSKNIKQNAWIKKKYLEKIVYVKFENEEFPIPEQYDELLTNIYGDYMKLPPVEKRGKWHEGVVILDPDVAYKKFIKENYNMIEEERSKINSDNQKYS